MTYYLIVHGTRHLIEFQLVVTLVRKAYVASPNYFKNRTLGFFVNKKIGNGFWILYRAETRPQCKEADRRQRLELLS